jgi:hypothetical protein
MNQQSHSQESRILTMVKKVLTDIAKDTHTPPGMRHPLSDNTINNMRSCLDLIVARETELNTLDGNVSASKPHFVDEPTDSVVVQLDTSKPDKKS